jgi:hypothetical protein
MASQSGSRLIDSPSAKRTTAHNKWLCIAAAIVMAESSVWAEAAMPTVPRLPPDPCRSCHMHFLAVHTAKVG